MDFVTLLESAWNIPLSAKSLCYIVLGLLDLLLCQSTIWIHSLLLSAKWSAVSELPRHWQPEALSIQGMCLATVYQLRLLSLTSPCLISFESLTSFLPYVDWSRLKTDCHEKKKNHTPEHRSYANLTPYVDTAKLTEECVHQPNYCCSRRWNSYSEGKNPSVTVGHVYVTGLQQHSCSTTVAL